MESYSLQHGFGSITEFSYRTALFSECQDCHSTHTVEKTSQVLAQRRDTIPVVMMMSILLSRSREEIMMVKLLHSLASNV